MQVISCELAVGTYQGYMATKYCMKVADVATSGLHFDETIG